MANTKAAVDASSINAANIKRAQEGALLYRMWATAFLIQLPALSIGTTMSFSVVGLPFYTKDDQLAGDPLPPAAPPPPLDDVVDMDDGGLRSLIATPRMWMTDDQVSWFVSVLSLMLMVGTMLSGSVTEKIGCIWTLRLSMIVELSGWLLIISANTFNCLIAGRILNGLGCGLSLPAAYMMLTDISLIRFRGIFAVLNSSACNVGFLIGLIIGAFASFQTVVICCTSISALFLLVSVLLPESPLWLVKHQQEDKAISILQFIRGPDYPVQMEVKEMVANTSSQENYSFGEVLKAAGKREFLTPFFILFFLVIVQGCSGSDTLSFYSVTIFKRANIDVDEYLMAILLQAGFTAGYIFIAPFMDMIDRRKLFMTASGMMAASLVVLGLTTGGDVVTPSSVGASTINETLVTAIDGVSHSPSKQEVIMKALLMYAPAFSVIMFSFSYGAGFGPAIYTWTSEIFPAQTKSLGCSTCLGFRNVVVFGMLKFYPLMISVLGLAKIMYFHAACLLVGLVWVYLLMPETRGMSMTQITAMFGGHKGSDVDSLAEQDLLKPSPPESEQSSEVGIECDSLVEHKTKPSNDILQV